jgi:hypothetical protein
VGGTVAGPARQAAAQEQVAEVGGAGGQHELVGLHTVSQVFL